MQSTAKFILRNVYRQLHLKDENKEKRGRKWPIFFKKTLGHTLLLLKLDKKSVAPSNGQFSQQTRHRVCRGWGTIQRGGVQYICLVRCRLPPQDGYVSVCLVLTLSRYDWGQQASYKHRLIMGKEWLPSPPLLPRLKCRRSFYNVFAFCGEATATPESRRKQSKRRKFSFSSTLQCDQIGRFFKVVADKICKKVAQMMGNFWAILKNLTLV